MGEFYFLAIAPLQFELEYCSYVIFCSICVCSGSLNDANGTLVGDFFPGIDTGILTADGIFYPEGIMGIRWVADQKNAYWHSTGVG